MVALRAVIEIRMDLPDDVLGVISRALEVESISAPPGGEIIVRTDSCSDSPLLKMTSEDLSTLRAMLNSYTGLLSAAVDVSLNE